MAGAWTVVFFAAVLLFTNTANSNSFGVFFKPIAEDFGWSRGIVSIAISLRWISAAVVAMPLGHFADSYGPRKLLLFSFILIGSAFLLTARITNVWELYILQGLAMGAGLPGVFICLMSTVAKWHDKRRGLALGIASAGAGLGGVVFPLVAAKLIGEIGWQDASAVLGVLTLAVAIPVSLMIKEPPDNRHAPAVRETGPKGENQAGQGRRSFETIRLLPRLLRDTRFLSLFMVFLLLFVSVQLVVSHLVNYVTDKGIDPVAAAAVLSVVGVGNVVGHLVSGAIADRIGTKSAIALCCAFVIISLLLLAWGAKPLMWISAAMFGLGWGGASPLVPGIMREYFGTKSLATMTGSILVGAYLGSAIGPWMGGFAYDLTGSYLPALVLSAALVTMAVLTISRMAPPAAAE